ncbi:MAG TPA: SdiA-regulated domain-containing protein [Cyclobacteriaceae bacterium]|nr:SdiA-regulated domain-containing protein [Cyclobacteriaceae bacterium]
MIFKPANLYAVFFLIIIPGICQVSCHRKPSGDSGINPVSSLFPYSIGKPDGSFAMPEFLAEISALEYFSDGILACVEDESGSLYLFNTGTGNVTRKIKFGEKGDYEGNAIKGDSAWVIKSNGELFMFRTDLGDNPESMTWHLPFNNKNDVEGLCYRDADHSLLIACKGDAGIQKELKGRAVYRFDIRAGKLDPDPVIHLTSDVYIDALKSFGLDPENHSPFKPSGISINPLNGNVFLISSIGRLLMIIDEDKEIVFMIPLPGRTFTQPEGICFSPEGDMFISSEGKVKDGIIYRFRNSK